MNKKMLLSTVKKEEKKKTYKKPSFRAFNSIKTQNTNVRENMMHMMSSGGGGGM